MKGITCEVMWESAQAFTSMVTPNWSKAGRVCWNAKCNFSSYTETNAKAKAKKKMMMSLQTWGLPDWWFVGWTQIPVSAVLAYINVKITLDNGNRSYRHPRQLGRLSMSNFATNLHFGGLIFGSKIKLMESTHSRNMKFTHNVD